MWAEGMGWAQVRVQPPLHHHARTLLVRPNKACQTVGVQCRQSIKSGIPLLQYNIASFSNTLVQQEISFSQHFYLIEFIFQEVPPSSLTLFPESIFLWCLCVCVYMCLFVCQLT